MKSSSFSAAAKRRSAAHCVVASASCDVRCCGYVHHAPKSPLIDVDGGVRYVKTKRCFVNHLQEASFARHAASNRRHGHMGLFFRRENLAALQCRSRRPFFNPRRSTSTASTLGSTAAAFITTTLPTQKSKHERERDPQTTVPSPTPKTSRPILGGVYTLPLFPAEFRGRRLDVSACLDARVIDAGGENSRFTLFLWSSTS